MNGVPSGVEMWKVGPCGSPIVMRSVSAWLTTAGAHVRLESRGGSAYSRAIAIVSADTADVSRAFSSGRGPQATAAIAIAKRMPRRLTSLVLIAILQDHKNSFHRRGAKTQ